ncbi:MAG: hypothetical protein M1821_006510 [Bathelium mastoideum]|nr:MAG: hypothetical protein M1821_006510 [Bathelium mastoideum]
MKFEIDPFVEPAQQDQERPENGINDNDGINGTASGSKESEANGTESSDDRVGQNCEVKEYEARYNLKMERITKAVDRKKDADDTESEDRKYAIKSYKYFASNGELEREEVEIYSPHIIKALQTTIKDYPGVSLSAEILIISGNPKCIFHYRKELARYRDELKDAVAKLHLFLALNYMEREFRGSIKKYEVLVEGALSNPSLDPSIGFQDIWMIFKPGELFIAGNEEKLELLRLDETTFICGSNCKWLIWGWCFTHDGNAFGYCQKKFEISPYEGNKPIKNLSVFPLIYHSEAETIRAQLLDRGKKFCSLRGTHYRSYDGIASALGNERDRNQYGLMDKFPIETTTISGRIVVDCRMFGIFKSPNRVDLWERHRNWRTLEDEPESITVEDLLICDYRVPGFSLRDKCWAWFSVDLIRPVEFDTDAFCSLLLPESRKNLVRAMVENHGSKKDKFDDVIKGKGKGLIFILHGVPGTGKTFTAESVADHVERPLYVLNSGELGVTPESVEINLRNALKLATAWNAIILIDEADVFLEQRTVQDLNRNCLVSLFLRVLEYYEGVLFLTTNRITTFDLAFKSRTHLALKFHELSESARKDLWKSFVRRTSNADIDAWPESIFDELAAVELNGRQIKNAVRTANTLAISSNAPISQEHLLIVLEAQKEFEADLNADTQDILSPVPKAVRRQSTGLSKLSIGKE